MEKTEQLAELNAELAQVKEWQKTAKNPVYQEWLESQVIKLENEIAELEHVDNGDD